MFSIYNQSNINEYNAIIKSLDIKTDIYYNSNFLVSNALLQNGEYEIFIAIDKNNYFIYPYIKIPFTFNNQVYYDLISPYGYAGPICNNGDFFKVAEDEFLAYISHQKNIITEFTRYHYTYNQDLRFKRNIINEKNREIVVLDINQPWDIVFKNELSSTAKNLYRKMEKDGYLFEIDAQFSEIDKFIELYYSNMNHASASDFYYFPKDFFYSLRDTLPNNMILAHIKKDGIIYCSSLFLLHSNIITYYLSGRDSTYPKVASNYFILSSIIKWGIENNYQLINFGGGRTTQQDDNLLKFKSHFSKAMKPFFTGKRVHKVELLEEIKRDFIQKSGMEEFKKKQHLLQFYR